MRHLLAAALLSLFTAPAFACINDAELPSHEREFRSQYAGSEVPPESAGDSTNTYLMYGAGGALLGGAFIMTLSAKRRAS